MPFPPDVLILVCAVFLLAGTVKGVIGLGLPSISLALLTATLGLPQAMALLVAPTVITNVWQALSGGGALKLLRRLWPFMALATATVWLGALGLARIDERLLQALLGLVLAVYALLSLCRLRFVIPPRHERWSGAVLGAANGLITGMTGSSVVPGVMYLQAIGLPRDLLVQAMGLLFTASTLALALSLQGHDLLTRELALVSLAATAPALLGQSLGRRLRQRLPEAAFRTGFFLTLLLLGVYILIRAGLA